VPPRRALAGHIGELSEGKEAARPKERITLSRRDAHTVLPLYPGIVIRLSNGCTLGTVLALISPQPRARAVSSCPALTCRVVGRFAMQPSRSAIVLEVITAVAVVALVAYVLFPPN
jgi:hypothetical protein